MSGVWTCVCVCEGGGGVCVYVDAPARAPRAAVLSSAHMPVPTRHAELCSARHVCVCVCVCHLQDG